METGSFLRILTLGKRAAKNSSTRSNSLSLKNTANNNAANHLFMLKLYSACIKGATTPKEFKEGVSEFRKIVWNAK